MARAVSNALDCVSLHALQPAPCRPAEVDAVDLLQDVFDLVREILGCPDTKARRSSPHQTSDHVDPGERIHPLAVYLRVQLDDDRHDCLSEPRALSTERRRGLPHPSHQRLELLGNRERRCQPRRGRQAASGDRGRGAEGAGVPDAEIREPGAPCHQRLPGGRHRLAGGDRPREPDRQERCGRPCRRTANRRTTDRFRSQFIGPLRKFAIPLSRLLDVVASVALLLLKRTIHRLRTVRRVLESQGCGRVCSAFCQECWRGGSGDETRSPVTDHDPVTRRPHTRRQAEADGEATHPETSRHARGHEMDRRQRDRVSRPPLSVDQLDVESRVAADRHVSQAKIRADIRVRAAAKNGGWLPGRNLVAVFLHIDRRDSCLHPRRP